MARSAFTGGFFPALLNHEGVFSWPMWPLRGINKTAWSAKPILTAYPMSCAQLGRLLMAQHLPFVFECLL